MTINMRIPTHKEWEKMMDICKENDAVTHWKDMFSWVSKGIYCAYCGFNSPRSWDCSFASNRRHDLGFRPAFDNLPSDGSENGTVRIIGTLYMDGIPVRIPSNPIDFQGDITYYIPNAKLEIREPMHDPQYQVRAIKVGSAFVADRALLKDISYADIMAAIAETDDSQADETSWLSSAMRIPDEKEWKQMMDVCCESNLVTHWKDMFSWTKTSYGHLTYVGNDSPSRREFATERTSWRAPYIGFRPAFDNLPPDEYENGAIRIIGTLYMDGTPVRVSSNPTKPSKEGDIQDYIPGAKLEIRKPLNDPQYQVRAIKVGSAFIADRVLLKKISYEDIMAAIFEDDDGKADTQVDRGQCENRWLSVEIGNHSMLTVCTHVSKEAAVSYANAKLAKIIAQSDASDIGVHRKSDDTKQILSVGYRNQNNRWDCYLMAETNIEILTQE